MLRESTSRLLTALRLALYPALESAEARHFQALTMEAQNARLSGDLAKAERLYLTAVAEAQSSHDASGLNLACHGLAQVYQEQHRFREAESIFQDQLEAAAKSPQPNTLVHAGHMSLAQLYEDEGKFAEAEIHYKAALAEARKNGSISRSRFLVFYFYVVGKVLHRSAAAQRGGTAISKGVGNF